MSKCFLISPWHFGLVPEYTPPVRTLNYSRINIISFVNYLLFSLHCSSLARLLRFGIQVKQSQRFSHCSQSNQIMFSIIIHLVILSMLLHITFAFCISSSSSSSHCGLRNQRLRSTTKRFSTWNYKKKKTYIRWSVANRNNRNTNDKTTLPKCMISNGLDSLGRELFAVILFLRIILGHWFSIEVSVARRDRRDEMRKEAIEKNYE